MKISVFFIVTLFSIGQCYAQTPVEKKTRLTDFVTEKYQTIIQNNKQVKQGVYNALYDKKTVIANGSYADNKRTGLWHFFNPEGKLMQNYDYTKAQLLYEASEDNFSNINYMIDYEVKEKDSTLITKPVRIGGRYYGYIPYLRQFKLPAEMQGAATEQYIVTLELLISPLGRLADFKIHIRHKNEKEDYKVININTDLLSEEDKLFIAATRNRQPISSRVLVQCYITRLDGIDTY